MKLPRITWLDALLILWFGAGVALCVHIAQQVLA